MHNNYSDITNLIEEQPKWWDENGVPRYETFHPNLLPDIYADEAVLYLIECQNCKREFEVAESFSIHNAMRIIQKHTCEHLSEADKEDYVWVRVEKYNDYPLGDFYE